MSRIATIGALVALSATVTQGQVPLLRAEGSRLDWRRIGNTSLELGLPSPATGAVTRVWYSPEGALFASTASGRVFQTTDFETWKQVAGVAPAKSSTVLAPAVPEQSARVERATASRYYAAGRFVYRSDDGGTNWTNLTGYRNQSILGEGRADIAISPRDPEEVAVGNQFGIWRSMDGGQTWAGLNQGLPNFPGIRLLSVPIGLQPARVAIRLEGGESLDLEWAPGERTAWRTSGRNTSAAEAGARLALTQKLGVTITATAAQGGSIYAGTADGRLFSSTDSGASWLAANALPDAGPVLSIATSRRDPRIAVVAFGPKSPDARGVRVARTSNGGRTLDDASSNLPFVPVNGVTLDQVSGSIYAGTADGVYYTSADLANLTFAAAWQRVSGGLPDGAVLDVRLDDASNQLYALVEGQGVFATLAPHRLRDWNIVNAADFSNRPAAPGALLSILGARIDRVRSGSLTVPVLSSTDSETQVQVPFEATGSTLALLLENGAGARSFGMPLAEVSPAIFVDRDGAALLLDADSGTALDAASPGRAGMRLQVLAAGLGAVDPAWPTGMPAPADNAPRVVAPIRVLLDGEPLEVLRATLAPGYIGFYVIEVQLPSIVNGGVAALTVEAAGRQSNPVRLYLAAAQRAPQ